MAVVHLSPELPRLTVRGHKREPSDPVDILSASYPSPGTVHLSVDADDTPGQLQRSYSGRPRSQSTFSQESVSKQRKSLRSLGRSRAVSSASGWISKGKQGSESGNRRASTSDADNATTEQIDSAFKKIREQLAVLSEEDQVLKERVDKLNEEINILNIPVQKLKQLQPTHHSTSILVSPTWATKRFHLSVTEDDFSIKNRQSRPSVPTLLVSRTDSPKENSRAVIINETISEQTTVLVDNNNCEATFQQKRRTSHPGNGKQHNTRLAGLTT